MSNKKPVTSFVHKNTPRKNTLPNTVKKVDLLYLTQAVLIPNRLRRNAEPLRHTVDMVSVGLPNVFRWWSSITRRNYTVATLPEAITLSYNDLYRAINDQVNELFNGTLGECNFSVNYIIDGQNKDDVLMLANHAALCVANYKKHLVQ